MDLETVKLSNVKDKYHMISLICVILKNGTNKFTKQKQSHRCRKQPYAYGRCWGGRDKLGLTKTHTTYQIDNKDLLYSTVYSIAQGTPLNTLV